MGHNGGGLGRKESQGWEGSEWPFHSLPVVLPPLSKEQVTLEGKPWV